MATSPVELLGSLARNRGSILRQVDRLLLAAVAGGENAATTARKVAQYLNPWYAERRAATGRVLRATREGILGAWPGRPGMASQFARGLMEHETTTAYGVAAITTAERTPGLGVRWRLSPGHAKRDECDRKANGSSAGQDRGVYRPEEFPAFPSHYRCRCIADTVPLRASR